VANALDAGGSVGVLRHAFGNLAAISRQSRYAVGDGSRGRPSFNGLSLVDQADWLH
jgi:hypothetical protein